MALWEEESCDKLINDIAPGSFLIVWDVAARRNATPLLFAENIGKKFRLIYIFLTFLRVENVIKIIWNVCPGSQGALNVLKKCTNYSYVGISQPLRQTRLLRNTLTIL